MLRLHVQFICCKVVDSHDAIVKMQKKKKISREKTLLNLVFC